MESLIGSAILDTTFFTAVFALFTAFTAVFLILMAAFEIGVKELGGSSPLLLRLALILLDEMIDSDRVNQNQ
jgi:hypothetical protein